ncbi:hypothetical protein Tco_0488406 [Tanacetum coccineum]
MVITGVCALSGVEVLGLGKKSPSWCIVVLQERRGQEFNWETDTYGKVKYIEDIDYFKDFKNEFPAIVYKDALTSEPEVSSEPTCHETASQSLATASEHTRDGVIETEDDVRMTVKLRNDILMFQQHQGESLSEAWTRFKDLLQKVPHHGIDLWFQVQIFYDHVNAVTRRTIDQSADGKLRDRNAKESWALLEDLALYDNESWNDPRDFTKQVKAISLPQDVPMNKITSSCEICSGPHDTQYCMENLEQAFVDYASSRTDEAGSKCSVNAITICPKQPNKSRDDKLEEEGREEKNNPENINITLPLPPDPSISFITEKVRKLNSFLESSGLVPRSSDTKFICTKEDDGELEEDEHAMTGGLGVEYFDIFPTRSELAYHKYLMSGLIPSLFLRNPIIVGGCPKLDPRENLNEGVSNFMGRIKGVNIFVGNFTYVSDFMIVEDISSIIDPRLSQVVLGKPFVEVSNMTCDLSEGVVKFTDETNEISYKMPHKIE